MAIATPLPMLLVDPVTRATLPSSRPAMKSPCLLRVTSTLTNESGDDPRFLIRYTGTIPACQGGPTSRLLPSGRRRGRRPRAGHRPGLRTRDQPPADDSRGRRSGGGWNARCQGGSGTILGQEGHFEQRPPETWLSSVSASNPT